MNGGIKILETAQKNELKTLVERIKNILEEHFSQKLKSMGIQQETSNLIPFEELIEYELIESDDIDDLKKKQEEFKLLTKTIHSLIQQEATVLEDWKESYYWYVDKLVYTFFNRMFAIRILEELDLLEESTFVPQPDLGNRSARMAKIQEQYPEKTPQEWHVYLLKDVFKEISRDIKVLFDETDPSLRIWPDGEIIEQIIHELNTVNPEIYKAEDCIGWFYHYYVLKFRKGHKTMSSHGQKSPKNPYYLSILNTVYTPRWMVRILLENSLGQWWLKRHPTSSLFAESPYFIRKFPADIENPVDKLEKLRILDPACGSGNFLIYAFKLLFQMYHEEYPGRSCTSIITSILTHNLYGIDINRRPAQLSALAMYVMAKRLLKECAPSELQSYKMPNVNIVCCDIRTPTSKEKTMLLQEVPDYLKKFIKDTDNLFNNADRLGSLIDVRDLKKQYQTLTKTTLNTYFTNQKNKWTDKVNNGIVSIIDNIIFTQEKQNIGLQLFGSQTKNALTLAQILMKKYDIIVTNPPFGLMIEKTKEYLKKVYPNSYNDLVSAFIDQSLRLTKNNGFIAMVADFSFLHLPKFENFRRKILLEKSFIQYLIITGLAALPDARNVPSLFVLRNVTSNKEMKGLYRYVEYSSSQQFLSEVYIREIKEDIDIINNWSEKEPLPKRWNQITQQRFLSLPRAVIDLNITEKFNLLLEFFTKYPRLDISQLKKNERKNIPQDHIGRVFQGISTGQNDLFIKFWYEIDPKKIRKVERIENISNVPLSRDKPFTPLSKGGGDIRYYLRNEFILWWNKDSINEMRKVYSAIRNPSLIGRAGIICPMASGKPRGRFNKAQKNVIQVATDGIYLIDKNLDYDSLLAYLNSKFGCFFGRMQTKDRKWPNGIIARFPIPIDFLKRNKEKLKNLSNESFGLRRDWDTGYPMSPIFAESLIDKVISPNFSIREIGVPKTKHPFCEEYKTCESEVTLNIEKIRVPAKTATIRILLNAVERRFELMTARLVKIDDEINQILYQLIDEETKTALEDYYDTFVGKTKFYPEREVWLKDFLMANLISIIKDFEKGIIPLKSQKENEKGLYEKFIDQLCQKFSRDLNSIQPILKELEELLDKPLLRWIAEDFFFYHCQRFGGRPIIWQFSSRSTWKAEAALDLFIDYHQINEITLSMIRVDYIQPLIKNLERRKEMGTLDDEYKIDELNDFLKAFIELEEGYPEIPTPNTLTGKRARPGAGDDKTWKWIFEEAKKIIQHGYKPDHFKGVLVNLIPLCLEVPENKQNKLKKNWKFLCPKGTIKQILKKIDTLDQLREK